MSTNLSMFKKIRCRFLHKETNVPVKGVNATLSVVVGDGQHAVNLPLAVLSSDDTGYMSFDLKSLIESGVHVSACLLSARKYGIEDLDLFASLKPQSQRSTLPDLAAEIRKGLIEGQEENGNENMNIVKPTKKSTCFVFPIYVNVPQETNTDCGCSDSKRQILPSVQNPDTCDYEISPFSFVNPTAINAGNDSCESMSPSSLPVQEYHFYKIVLKDDIDTTPAAEALTKFKTKLSNVSAKINPVDITSQLTAAPATVPAIRFAMLLDYRQLWFSLGHSLGEIKYSLPLAPGESTQLAVIEWSRQDNASRKDGIAATEYLDHDSRRERSIEDTVTAALSENQDGWNMMGGTSVSAMIPVEPVTISVNAAFGGGVSHSSGNRNIEGESLQDLHDRVRQTSAYVRSLNSTVIVQSSQAESNAVQTRRVANHNHCHALTIQYYEVLRHYKLHTEFKGKRNAVLIPFSIFRFTEAIALRFRQVLVGMLLDQSLKDCFDALIRLQMPELYPERSNTVTLNGFSAGESNMMASGVIVKRGDMINLSAAGEINFNVNVADSKKLGPNGEGAKPTSAGNFFCGIEMNMLSLCFRIGNGKWQQGGISVSTIADGDGEIFLVANDVKNGFADNNGAWIVNVMASATGSQLQQQPNSIAGIANTDPADAGMEDKATTHPTFKVNGRRDGDIYKRTEYGTRSGIFVKPGDVINSLSATGRINVGDGNALGYTADGHDTLLGGALAVAGTARELRWYSLMFRIGFDDDWRQAGTQKQNIKIEKSGELIFMINDGNYDDNTGEFDVSLTITTKVKKPVKTVSTEPVQQVFNVNSSSTIISPTVTDKFAALKLLTHLNSNQGYYNRVVWMKMDAVERRLYLENTLSEFPEILNVMDDMPLAVTGNYLAFPCDFPGGQEPVNTATTKTVAGECVEDIVCFPTRGLFAEAQLGHCNSCEKRDITRMWDWNVMTTETPPDISGITPGPKGSDISLTPTQLPGNVIQITQPQNAPDPSGLANALTLLGNGNAFRDMSGLNQVSGLLGQLARQSGDTLNRQLAIQAKKKVDDLRNGLSGGGGNGVGNSPGSQNSRPTGAEREEHLNAAVQEAMAMGLSEKETAQWIKDSEKKYNLIDAGAIASTDDTFLPGNSIAEPKGRFIISGTSVENLDAFFDFGQVISNNINDRVTAPPQYGDEHICVHATYQYIVDSLVAIDVEMESIKLQKMPLYFPHIKANSGLIYWKPFITLFYSNYGNFNNDILRKYWLQLPRQYRGLGPIGALLYANLIEGGLAGITISEIGWPTNMEAGTIMQLWTSKAVFERVRDLTGKDADIDTGHCPIFLKYKEGDPLTIIVADQYDTSVEYTYPYSGLRYIIAAKPKKKVMLIES